MDYTTWQGMCVSGVGIGMATPYGQPTTTNPTGPATGSSRVLRGGSWYGYAVYTRCADRNPYNPLLTANNVGFRCVRGL